MLGERDTASSQTAEVARFEISPDELEALALSADPDSAPADDAVPLHEFLASEFPAGALVPGWYMPAPIPPARPLPGWRRRVVMLIIASFLLINAYGLCSTYGYVGFG